MTTIFSFFILFTSYFMSVHGRSMSLEESHIMLPSQNLQSFTHLHFYFHDILDGEKATTLKIINPPSESSHGPFGATYIIDNPLTKEQNLSSKVIGRAQG